MSNQKECKKIAGHYSHLPELPEGERQIINMLNTIQHRNGFISEQDLQDISLELKKPLSELHGLVSFFHSLRTRPLGRNHISVCCGTACYARGAHQIFERLAGDQLLDEYGTSNDGFITIDKVQCVGACSLAPVINTNGTLEVRVKPNQMPSKIEELRKHDAIPE